MGEKEQTEKSKLNNEIVNKDGVINTIPGDFEMLDLLLDKEESVTVVKNPHQVLFEGNESTSDEPLISCLRNKVIKIKFIPRKSGLVTDPKHVLYGGMSQTSKRRYCVDVTRNGQFVNALTNSEKTFLEQAMGLASNALSIYNKENNY